MSLRHLICGIAVVVLVSASAWGLDHPIKTSVCEVAKDPQRFDNKIVQLRATVVSGFEIFAIRDPEAECQSIWLSYAGGGPVASVSFGQQSPDLERSPIQLREDREFKKFRRLLDAQMYPRSREESCMVCNRYEVTATMTGRVDFAGEHGGFGHMNMSKLQFVLASIQGSSAKDLSENYDLHKFSPAPVHLPTAFFSGSVISQDGKPVQGAEVNVRSVDDTEPYLHDVTDWVDEKGHFKISVPPGTYVVGVNLSTPPSEHIPFSVAYSPGTPDVHSARTYMVQDGEHEKVKILLGPALTRRTIPVRVVWPDGKPVADANVWLKEVRNPIPVVGGPVSHTDLLGTFDLVGFEGIDYIVSADIYVKPAYSPYCAKQQTVKADTKIDGRLEFVLSIAGDVCRSH